MQRWLLIGVGGFVGTLGRYWLGNLVSRRYGETFPIGTLVINALGCLIAGALFYLIWDRASPTTRAVIFTGLLGGFTTFSAYGLQTFTLIRDGELVGALLNIGASNVLCLLLVWVGYSLAKMIV